MYGESDSFYATEEGRVAIECLMRATAFICERAMKMDPAQAIWFKKEVAGDFETMLGLHVNAQSH